MTRGTMRQHPLLIAVAIASLFWAAGLATYALVTAGSACPVVGAREVISPTAWMVGGGHLYVWDGKSLHEPSEERESELEQIAIAAGYRNIGTVECVSGAPCDCGTRFSAPEEP